MVSIKDEGLQLYLPSFRHITNLSELSNCIHEYQQKLQKAVEAIRQSKSLDEAERINNVEQILTSYYNVGLFPVEEQLIEMSEKEIAEKECLAFWQEGALHLRERETRIRLHKILDSYQEKIKAEIIEEEVNDWQESLEELLETARKQGINDQNFAAHYYENSKKVYQIWQEIEAKRAQRSYNRER